MAMKTQEQCIAVEVSRLQIVIGALSYDYDDAVLLGKPKLFRDLIGAELQESKHNLLCLRLKMYNKMTYNVKLLFDK